MALELSTPLDIICRLIIRGREMEAQVPSTDPDDDEEPDDVDDEFAVLDDEVNEAVEEEMRTALEDLAEDQIAEVLALALIGRGTYDASEWDEALDAANDLIAVLNTTLDSETAEAGRLAVDPRPIDVVALVRDLTLLHRPNAAAKGLELSVHVAPELTIAEAGAAIADALRARQILANLIGNALKFTLRGRVEARIELVSPNRIAIEVADTGPGLAPEELEAAFEPFNRIARTSAGTSSCKGSTDASGHDKLFPTSAPFKPSTGFAVYRDPQDRWVSSRPIWNQYAYSITNVLDDATIPKASAVLRNWEQPGLNNFRQNAQGSLKATALADLTVELQDADKLCSGAAGSFTVSAQVCNRGTNPVQDGASVVFQQQVKGQAATALCSAVTDTLLTPGDCTIVSCDGAIGDNSDVLVAVDPKSTIADCHPGNNQGASARVLCGKP